MSRLLSRLVVNIVVIASSSASGVSIFGIFFAGVWTTQSLRQQCLTLHWQLYNGNDEDFDPNDDIDHDDNDDGRDV